MDIDQVAIYGVTYEVGTNVNVFHARMGLGVVAACYGALVIAI